MPDDNLNNENCCYLKPNCKDGGTKVLKQVYFIAVPYGSTPPLLEE